MPDPIELTSIPLPFDSPYVIKTGRIQGRVPYPYLLRNDDFKIGLPPEITIEEITKELIADLEKKQEASLSKERIICECPECGTSIYIKLGPNGSFYIQHGVKEKGVRQDKCIYKNMIGPIFEDEDPDNLTPDEAIERFSLSAKNPRHIVSENGWDYMTAVGPYGGYSMKQRTRQVFDNDELKTLKKDEIFELIEEKVSDSSIDGRSNVPLIKDQKMDDLPVYIETGSKSPREIGKVVGIRTSNYKYFRSRDNPKDGVNLYDLKNDPNEENNIQDEILIKKMEDILLEILNKSKSSVKKEITDDEAQKLEEELRKMGYI